MMEWQVCRLGPGPWVRAVWAGQSVEAWAKASSGLEWRWELVGWRWELVECQWERLAGWIDLQWKNMLVSVGRCMLFR